MLKKRLIPVILVRDGMLVQSIGFKRYLPIGKPKIAVEFFNRWDVDEIIVLDISRNRGTDDTLYEMTKHVSTASFIPLTVGGGINSIEAIEKLLKAGADKVTINTAAVRNPSFVEEAAKYFGSQEIVVSIDAKKSEQNGYEAFIDGGREATGLHPAVLAKWVEDLGAGEILLNSIDNDGMKNGYDINLISSVTEKISIPLISIGGVGRVEDLPECINSGGADAAAAANIFHYIEHSTIQGKAAMHRAGLPVRLMGAISYGDKLLHSTGK